MEQVEIFCQTYASDIQKQINKWLSEMGDKIEVTRVLQNSNAFYSPSSGNDRTIIISIFYKMK